MKIARGEEKALEREKRNESTISLCRHSRSKMEVYFLH
ncbi:hypothetical protein LINPERHAP1_LOCUS23329 [Linum perenne]